jgi:hypothetical protein
VSDRLKPIANLLTDILNDAPAVLHKKTKTGFRRFWFFNNNGSSSDSGMKFTEKMKVDCQPKSSCNKE